MVLQFNLLKVKNVFCCIDIKKQLKVKVVAAPVCNGVDSVPFMALCTVLFYGVH